MSSLADTPNGDNSSSQSTDLTGSELLLTPYSEIEARQTEWLWYPYLPLGSVTTVEGNMGEGKSWLTLALAAAVSTGRFPVTSETREPATVLHINVEDSPAETVKPRLDGLGADSQRVIGIHGVSKVAPDGKHVLAFTLEHLPALRSAIEKTGAKLVILDPMQAYLPQGADMNKAESMRPLITKLSQLAQKTRSVILVVRHFGKRLTETALHKALGSVDIAAAVRSVLFVGADPYFTPEGTDFCKRCVVIHAKSNLAPTGPSLAFELRLNQFKWFGHSAATAEELTSFGPLGSSDNPRYQVQDAMAFLQEHLANGLDDRAKIIQAARAQGISERTLDRAASRLGIVKEPLRAAGRVSGSMWSLPTGSEAQQAA